MLNTRHLTASALPGSERDLPLRRLRGAFVILQLLSDMWADTIVNVEENRRRAVAAQHDTTIELADLYRAKSHLSQAVCQFERHEVNAYCYRRKRIAVATSTLIAIIAALRWLGPTPPGFAPPRVRAHECTSTSASQGNLVLARTARGNRNAARSPPIPAIPRDGDSKNQPSHQ